MKKPSVIIGMSGGVDSSVAALVLKKEFNVIGVSLRLLNDYNVHRRSCCSPEDLYDAARVADRLSIPHYVIDRRELFKNEIIGKYVEYYKNGMTPNPCSWCNRLVKFKALLYVAEMIGAHYVATGHYSKIAQHNGHLHVSRAADPAKDQSYFLYGLSDFPLNRIIFPLSNMTKETVKKIAIENDIPVFRKRESQQACFLPEGGNRQYLASVIGENTDGKFVDTNGNLLGTHKGYWFYTIGQRRGLGLGKETKYYVKKIMPDKNTVVLSNDVDLYSKIVLVENPIFSSSCPPVVGGEYLVQIRHGHNPEKAKLLEFSNKHILLEFSKAQRAITPGQVAVLYENDMIIAGGEIRDYED